MAMRPTQINNGFLYKTRNNAAATTGFEPGNFVRVEGTPLIVNAIYIATSLAIPIPSWILLFDRVAGNDPQGGEVADQPGPRIVIAGEVINFVPPAEKIDLVDFIDRCKSPEGDRDDLGLIYGQPFDNGLVVVLSATPVAYTVVPGAFINVVVRGRNLP